MTDAIKAGLVQRLKPVGTYDVRVADPHVVGCGACFRMHIRTVMSF
jgi:hypothetical protein